MKFAYKLPIVWTLVLKNLKCYITHIPKNFRNTSQQWYLLRYIHSALLHVLGTQSAHNPGQLWSNDHGVYTYCDMLLKLCTCNSRTDSAAKEYALRHRGRRLLDATAFRRLKQRLRKTVVLHLRHTRMPTDYTDIKQLICPNCSCGTTALKKLTRCHTRNTSWCSSASTPLVAEHASVSGRSSSRCEAEVVVSTRQSSSAQWGRCPAIAEGGLNVLGRFRGLLSHWI
jgi:hypothetical protein